MEVSPRVRWCIATTWWCFNEPRPMHRPPSRQLAPLRQLTEVMALLRSPEGCPWDREQDHQSLRFHAVEEVYELLDAIEARDDREMLEELGDLLLQVVFHCQLARERKAFDLDQVAQVLVDKLVRRHPHVFGDTRVRDVDEVWANWDRIKRAEKDGTRHARPSALDGIPKHLPSLMRAEKLSKKARKAGLLAGPRSSRRAASAAENAADTATTAEVGGASSRRALARRLFDLAEAAQARGWSAEDLLREESARRERAWRQLERRAAAKAAPAGSAQAGGGGGRRVVGAKARRSGRRATG